MKKTKLIFEHQFGHLFALTLLIIGVNVVSHLPGFFDGKLLGVPTGIWIFLAIATPIVHQVYVWFMWRTELHLKLISNWWGAQAFRRYKKGFFTLFILRAVFLLILAISNRGTLNIHPVIMKGVAILFLFPVGYLFYSVKKYFSFNRAAGLDHFDPKICDRPLICKGIFQYASNSMYLFGFLAYWIPALWFSSLAAVTVALFSHIYIWVHFVCTEEPDMKRIYGI